MFKSARLLNQKGSPRFGEAGLAPIAVIIAIVIVLAGGGGLYYQSVYKPALIKESTSKIQSDYKTLSSSVDDLLDKMTEDKSSDNDPDSLKKSLDETGSLRSKAETSANSIAQSLSKKQSEISTYSSSVENYLNITKELLIFSKSGLDLSTTVTEAMVEIKNISSDTGGNAKTPEAVSQKIKDSISKLDKLIKDLDEMSVEKEYKDAKKSYVALLIVLKDYFEDLGKAMDTSNSSAVATAQNKFNTDGVKVAKEVDDANKTVQEKVKELKNSIKDKARDVESTYGSLDSKYK